MSELLLLVRIALRNLFSSFLNFVIGGIILVGTLLFVVGGSTLNSMDSAMSRSITGSIAGDVQVYSDKSKDKLALFGDWGRPDISAITDFAKIKAPLLKIENVKAVIPMGVDGAAVTYGNTVDQILEKLRHAVNARAAGDKSPELAARIDSLVGHVRQMLGVIQNDYKKLAQMASAESIDREGLKALDHAGTPEFWKGFATKPFDTLEYLENKVASLVPDADMVYLSYVGTDLDAYRAAFDRMEVVDGAMVPTGARGMMLSKYMYETAFKLKIAHRLDKIKESIEEKGHKISTDPDLALMVKQNRTQTRELLLQLDPLSSQVAATKIATLLGSKETDLPKLLSSFLDTNDENFLARYAFFYKEIAPLVDLYRLKPGDYITIKAYTRSGFVQSANIKIHGTFQFKGLEKSGLAGSTSLMDLMSFRDLYGYVTPEKLAESQELKKESGVAFVDRDSAESALFGGASAVQTVQSAHIDDQREMGEVKSATTQKSLQNRIYTPAEIETGVVLNSAILLKDPSRIGATMSAIEEISKREKLDLRVVSWQDAAGDIGQFVFIAKLILYFAVSIIFIVALVIINNAVMMATLQRVREIGTMRAIGAQRSFVLALVVVETLLLGCVFGSVGTLIGALVVKWLGHIGIPAGNEFLYFFFSGPRLYVGLSVGSLIAAFGIICVVTVISALYPAIVATRVSPLQAMQTED